MASRIFLIFNVIRRSDTVGITRIEKVCEIKQRRFIPTSLRCVSVGGMICKILLVGI